MLFLDLSFSLSHPHPHPHRLNHQRPELSQSRRFQTTSVATKEDFNLEGDCLTRWTRYRPILTRSTRSIMARSLAGGRGSSSDRGSSRGRGRARDSSSSAGHGDETADYTSPDIQMHDGLDVIGGADDVESSHMGRGSNASEQVPPLPSQRTMIWMHGQEFGDVSVSRRIISIFKNMFHGPWVSWRDVGPASHERMWQHFQGIFQWDSRIDEEVRAAWEDVMKKRYADVKRDARRDAARRVAAASTPFDGDDFSVFRSYSPTWIREEYWVIMIDKVWNTAEWKAWSKAGQQNKNTVHDGVMSKHTGGSISITQHRMRMEKEKGRPPTASEVFERTYLKKGSTSGSKTREFVNPRAQQVLDAYQGAMVQKYGPDVDAHPSGDTELWEQCVGGRRKGRLFADGS